MDILDHSAKILATALRQVKSATSQMAYVSQVVPMAGRVKGVRQVGL